MAQRQVLSNQEIARIFYQIGEYLEMAGVAFKPRAFQRAARAIESLEEPLSEIYAKGGIKALEDIPGVGLSIAEKIEELVKTARLRYFEALRKKIPVDVTGLSSIEGVGPQSIKVLWKKLGVKSVADLEKAARQGRVRNLPRFGKKSEKKILESIGFYKSHSGRFPIGDVLPLALDIEQRFNLLPFVQKAVLAGSLRRRKETIGDGDMLVVSNQPGKVSEFFIKMPEVERVYSKGPTKIMARLSIGMDFDLRIVAKSSFGAALNYFTGSIDHNIALRKLAIKKGWKLNEYGLYRKSKAQNPISKNGWKMIAGLNEEELYRRLGLAYIEPEMREMTGEIELARKNFSKKFALPGLIGYGDLQGDLQVQSNWSDGEDSIEVLAKAAKKRGLSYIAITDHTKSLTVARGLDEKRVKKQMAEIDRINKKVSGVTVLKGIECDIKKDGSLDLNDAVLAKLDVVGVSVHSYFNLPRAEQTKRIIRAISNSNVDILFHPTGRLLSKRKPYDFDIEEVIKVCKKTGTVLETNAFPDRLDLNDAHIRVAIEAGVKIAIDSDAHSAAHFSVLEYGIAQARRGWAKKTHVINAWPVQKMKKMLK